LVSSLANAISQTANENPLRTYLFNQMSVNNWRNDEFRELASVAAIYTLSKLREGAHRQNGGVERFIEIVADKMVEARAAFNAQVDQELRYEVPERKIADVKNAARVWESVREDSWEALRRYREASQRNRYDSNRGWGNDRDYRGSQRSGGWGEDGYASHDLSRSGFVGWPRDSDEAPPKSPRERSPTHVLHSSHQRSCAQAPRSVAPDRLVR
jgi:hypothetical protein